MIIITLAFTLTIISIVPITTQTTNENLQQNNVPVVYESASIDNIDNDLILNEFRNTEYKIEQFMYNVTSQPVAPATETENNNSAGDNSTASTESNSTVIENSTVAENSDILIENSVSVIENSEPVNEESSIKDRETLGTTDGFYCYSSFTYNGITRNVLLDESLQSFLYDECLGYGLDYELILALIGCESGWNVNVVSNGRCIGLGMISTISLPALNKAIGITDLSDPKQNIQAVCYLMSTKLAYNNNSVNAALMSYNKGQAGAEYCFNQGIYETDYTKKVLGFQQAMKQVRAAG